MVFNPSAAGKNSLNAEAGLLTYPLPMPSQPIFEVLPRSQWQRFSAVITTQKSVADLQQRGLSGIFTRFPFHRNPQNGSLRTFADANIEIFLARCYTLPYFFYIFVLLKMFFNLKI